MNPFKWLRRRKAREDEAAEAIRQAHLDDLGRPAPGFADAPQDRCGRATYAGWFHARPLLSGSTVGPEGLDLKDDG